MNPNRREADQLAFSKSSRGVEQCEIILTVLSATTATESKTSPEKKHLGNICYSRHCILLWFNMHIVGKAPHKWSLVEVFNSLNTEQKWRNELRILKKKIDWSPVEQIHEKPTCRDPLESAISYFSKKLWKWLNFRDKKRFGLVCSLIYEPNLRTLQNANKAGIDVCYFLNKDTSWQHSLVER
mgnify:CR=1 FL=1